MPTPDPLANSNTFRLLIDGGLAIWVISIPCVELDALYRCYFAGIANPDAPKTYLHDLAANPKAPTLDQVYQVEAVKQA